jgi:hypothetical protein
MPDEEKNVETGNEAPGEQPATEVAEAPAEAPSEAPAPEVPAEPKTGDPCTCPDGRAGTVHILDEGLVCLPNQG